jgi:hypothetical protein
MIGQRRLSTTVWPRVSIFGDWDQTVRWQGEVLERLIRAEVGESLMSGSTARRG